MLNKIKAVLKEGYNVASGQSKDEQFPEGTISLQKKFFDKEINFDNFYLGTLNFSIAPFKFDIKKSDFSFFDIEWFDGEKENFFFVECELDFNSRFYK